MPFVVAFDKNPLAQFTSSVAECGLNKTVFENKELFWLLFCKACIDANSHREYHNYFCIDDYSNKFHFYGRDCDLKEAQNTIESIRLILLNTLKPRTQTDFLVIRHYQEFYIEHNPNSNFSIAREKGECSFNLFKTYIENSLPILARFLGISLEIHTNQQRIIKIKGDLDFIPVKNNSELFTKSVTQYKMLWKPEKARKPLLEAFAKLSVVTCNAPPQEEQPNIVLSTNVASNPFCNTHPQEEKSNTVLSVTTTTSNSSVYNPTNLFHEKVTNSVINSVEDMGEYFDQQHVVSMSETIKISSFTSKFSLVSVSFKTFYAIKKYFYAADNLQALREDIALLKVKITQLKPDNPVFSIIQARIERLKAVKNQNKITLKTRLVTALDKIVLNMLTMNKVMVLFGLTLGSAASSIFSGIALTGFAVTFIIFILKLAAEFYKARYAVPYYFQRLLLNLSKYKNATYKEWYARKFEQTEILLTKLTNQYNYKGALMNSELISKTRKIKIEQSILKIKQKLELSKSQKEYYLGQLNFCESNEKSLQQQTLNLDESIQFHQMRSNFRNFDEKEISELFMHLENIVRDHSKSQIVREYFKDNGITLNENYSSSDLFSLITTVH
ncbi:MAG: hypothetical protein WC222_09220 [Parachlamydiales bacterium]|jgi:hypothetical protein